ncbi:MAG: glycosyltransferase family 2 protein [Sulfuricaulis sp.]
MDISAILVSYNTEELLPGVLNALNKSAGQLRLQTIIVDNASRDGSVALIRRDYAECELIENDINVGFGRANNQALPLIQSRYVLLLNTDAFVSRDTLEKTVAYMDEHERCGILGVKLVGRDGKLQPSCRYFPTPFNRFLNRTGLHRLFPWIRLMDDMNWDHTSTRQCDWVPGCFMVIRREVIDQVGLFDKRYFLYSEEVDFCFAAKKAGWQVHYYPATTVVHIGGESAKSDSVITESGRQVEQLQIESELLYFRKNHGLAAVLLHFILTALADFIVPLKRFLKGKRPVSWKRYWQHTLLYWSLCRKTRWGCNSVR